MEDTLAIQHPFRSPWFFDFEFCRLCRLNWLTRVYDINCKRKLRVLDVLKFPRFAKYLHFIIRLITESMW